MFLRRRCVGRDVRAEANEGEVLSEGGFETVDFFWLFRSVVVITFFIVGLIS